jgi:hypothetical protein
MMMGGISILVLSGNVVAFASGTPMNAHTTVKSGFAPSSACQQQRDITA